VAKKEKTFQRVSSVWRVDSRMPSSNTRRAVHGWPAEKKYQRRASAPCVSNRYHGSMMLPFDFDIFWPSASTMKPRHTTLRYGVASKASVLTASSE
jgi:hypothetical protein